MTGILPPDGPDVAMIDETARIKNDITLAGARNVHKNRSVTAGSSGVRIWAQYAIAAIILAALASSLI